MLERFQRHLGPVGSLQPKQYTLATASGQPALCCPECGAISDLPVTHRTLDGEGAVSPIWTCPIGPCTYQVFVVLQDLDEEVV